MKKYGLFLNVLLMTNLCLPARFTAETSHKIGPVNIRLSQPQIISGKAIAITAVTILAAKIAYDLSWHNTYATKANDMYRQLENTIQENHIDFVSHSALLNLAYQIDCDDILRYQLWVNNSYNNWLFPWNWTASQREALNKLKVVEVLTLYADLVALSDLCDGNITSSDVSQILRTKFMSISLYPLVSSYTALQNALIFITSNKHTFCNPQIKSLIQKMRHYLMKFQTLLREDKDYILELQTKRMHELQQETINAINASRF